MTELNGYRIKIKIDLTPGIWVFDSEQSTGKTYLCKQLKELETLGEPVGGFTYEDIRLGQSLVEFLKNPKYDVVMLDRYDMYPNTAHKEIREASESKVVLIDCKQGFTGSANDNICYINLTSDCIEVFAY